MLSDEELAEFGRREILLLSSAVRASAKQVRAFLHKDFVEFGASGRTWNRANVVAALSAEPAVSGDAADLRVAQLADDVVLVTYRMEGARPSLRSSVWIRDADGEWRLRFHHGSRSHI